ncbi:unnamed protein product [Clavelina lepadiformis]|uniref:carbonic anhydrase n=1 Tax=Clavelina lepadiformis TaxID=159417 RepID=A0ABP0F992_CLALP
MYFRILIVVSLLSIAHRSSSKDCSGKNHAIVGNREIRLFNEKKTYDEALISCMEWGQKWKSEKTAHLASILSAEDQTCINEMIANPENYKPNQWSENMYDPGYFVGATDAAEEGKWKWPNKDDDEEWFYNNWARLEPNNYGYGEHCVQLLMVDNDFYDYNIGKWIDVSCSSRKFYVCERVIPNEFLWGFENHPHAIPPSNWVDLYKTCGGTRQSPIDLKDACDGSSLPKIRGFLGTSHHEWIVQNTGRFIKIDVQPKRSMWTTFRRSGKRYYIDHMILKRGSDHTVDDTHYWGELQVFHEHHELGQRHAFAFFIKNRDGVRNQYWNELLETVNFVQETGLRKSMPAPQRFLKELLRDSAEDGIPANLVLYDFVQYKGSLPYPPCTEDVIWTVFKTPLVVSTQQLSVLRHTHMEDGSLLMENNFRPVQHNSRNC